MSLHRVHPPPDNLALDLRLPAAAEVLAEHVDGGVVLEVARAEELEENGGGQPWSPRPWSAGENEAMTPRSDAAEMVVVSEIQR
jgi:hypothetical protein